MIKVKITSFVNFNSKICTQIILLFETKLTAKYKTNINVNYTVIQFYVFHNYSSFNNKTCYFIF